MLPVGFIINRKLDIETNSPFVKTQGQKLIDYTKMAELPYLEIREAIDLFTGVTAFQYIWKILSKKDQTYLQRDKVFFNGPSKRKDQTFKWKNDLYKEFIKMNNSTKNPKECHIIEILPELEAARQGIYYDYQEVDTELYTYNFQTLGPYISQKLDMPQSDEFILNNIENEMKIYYLQNEFNLYLCKTELLLHWALFNGIILPQKLQEEFKIIQANPPTAPLNITDIRYTQIQATAQFLLTLEKDRLLSIRDIIDRMEKLVTEGKLRKHGDLEGPLETIYAEKLYFNDEKYTELYKLIREIYSRPKGRPKKRSLYSENTHSLKLIPRVFLPTARCVA